MSTDMVKKDAHLCALQSIGFSEDGTLQLRNLGEAYVVAVLLIRAGWAPKGCTLDGAVVSIMQGKKLGLDPMTSLQGIASINGRPSLWGDVLVAVVKASGLVEDEKIEYLPDTKNVQGVRYTVKRKGIPTPTVGFFSMALAKQAGLLGKGTWQTSPIRMLLHRARTFALRDAFPDVLKGLASAEEELDAARGGAVRPAVMLDEVVPDAVPEAVPEVEAPKPRRKRAPASALPPPPSEVLAVPQDMAPADAVASGDFEGDKPAPGDGGQYTHGFAPIPDDDGSLCRPMTEAPVDSGDFLD